MSLAPAGAPTPGATAASPPPSSPIQQPATAWVAVVAAAALVVGCAAAGWWLTRHGVRLHLGSAYPLSGHYRLYLSGWLAAPAAVGMLIWRYGPRAAAGLRWPSLLGASFVAAGAWAVSLAVVAGPAAIAAPLTTRYEYLADVSRIAAMDLGAYLRTFTWYIVDTGHGPVWAVQVSGHPPLATLLFVALAKAGLPHAGWAAALCIAGGAGAAPAILSTVRVLAGEPVARAAAPFVAAAPVALWIATSADGLYAGVAAAGICGLAHAAGRHDRRGHLLALTGGLLLGGCLFLSYGLVLITPLAVAVVAVQRRIAPLLVAAAPVLAIVAGFAMAGFWWLDGLHLVVRRIVEGGAYLDRPRAYFLFANAAALAVTLGPAVVAAVPLAWRARRHLRLVALPTAALLALVAAVVSDLSKGEVERIYLPWAVWLLPLAALLPGSTRRGWLAVQLGWALLIAATTRLDW